MTLSAYSAPQPVHHPALPDATTTVCPAIDDGGHSTGWPNEWPEFGEVPALVAGVLVIAVVVAPA